MFDSFMGIPGHRFIEILTIETDGGELDALTAFLSARAAGGNARLVGQLQLEIHVHEGRENFEYFARLVGDAEGGGPQTFLDEAEPSTFTQSRFLLGKKNPSPHVIKSHGILLCFLR
ncbi:hypothetical protein EDB83DRAFT_2527672 [Lactarius deliciosus]|nr:hypothetical protein EDB83DRAFT_2527672 [Lactarius deliciosus]